MVQWAEKLPRKASLIDHLIRICSPRADPDAAVENGDWDPSYQITLARMQTTAFKIGVL